MLAVAGRRRASAVAACTALGLTLALPAGDAGAEVTVIRSARTPIDYAAELEPHVVLGSGPPGRGAGSGGGIGARASIVLSSDGFLRGVNDSLALGFGFDYGRYAAAYGFYGYRDECLRFEPGPAGTAVCTDVTSNGGTYNYLFVPVVLQWNFWLTERFSAFGEPGISFYHLGDGFAATGALYVGGRFRLADRITLTARLGYPTLAFGVSFML
jgi:hypothetical protein